MSTDLRIEDFRWLAQGVFWAGLAVVGFLNYTRMPDYAKIGFWAIVVITLYLRDLQPQDSLAMQACTNHSTSAACANRGMCELASQTFAMDEEWDLYRRNACMDGVIASKRMLYNSYDPSRCHFWGSCEQECVDRLTDIKTQIDAYACPEEVGNNKTLEDLVDKFPLTQSKILEVFPFNVDGMMAVWGTLAILLCILLVVVRSISIAGKRPF